MTYHPSSAAVDDDAVYHQQQPRKKKYYDSANPALDPQSLLTLYSVRAVALTALVLYYIVTLSLGLLVVVEG